MSNLGWRLASTEAGLQKGNFFVWKIPPPSTFEYKDYSTRMPQSQGGQSRHGYSSITILWEGLDTAQSHALRFIVEAGLNDAGFVYLTIDRSNGNASGRDWIDVRVRPEMPDFRPRAPVAGSNGILHDQVRFFGNDLFIVNDPASF
jgi:hypothetical protein